MPHVRIFASFDLEHDHDLFDLLLEHSRRNSSGFEVASRSERSRASESGSDALRRRISEADEVVIICGEHSADSPDMCTELRITQEEKKPYLLLWGRRERMCKRPLGARSSDAMYSWTREILEEQIVQTIRNAQPREIPADCRRSPFVKRKD